MAARTRKTLTVLVLIDILLVTASLLRFPGAGLLSAAAPIGILVVVGVSGWILLPKVDRLSADIARIGALYGLLAGLVLAGEVVLEYILLPKDNSTYGLVEFGLFLVLLFAAGMITSLRSGSAKSGAIAALLSAVFASLVWYAFVLVVFHLFWGSPQQTQVFTAEGNYDDFTHSGGNDFNSFIVQDFFGAGFFHLLLGSVIGTLLGFVGGLAGKLGVYLGRQSGRQS